MVWWKRSTFPFVCGRYGRIVMWRIWLSASSPASSLFLVYAQALSVINRLTRMWWAANQARARSTNPVTVWARSSSWSST